MTQKFRRIVVISISIILLLLLIFGIGIVDNSIKTAQDNPFLNKIYINREMGFAFLRYLNITIKIPFGFDYFKPLFYSVIVIFGVIKSMIFDTVLK